MTKYNLKQKKICCQMITLSAKRVTILFFWQKFDNSGHSGLLLTKTCHLHTAQTCKPRHIIFTIIFYIKKATKQYISEYDMKTGFFLSAA